MSAEAELNKFVRGSVGYIELAAGQTASFNPINKSEINGIESVGDATLDVEQYGVYTDGVVTLTDGRQRFGKFHKVTVTSGVALIYSNDLPAVYPTGAVLGDCEIDYVDATCVWNDSEVPTVGLVDKSINIATHVAPEDPPAVTTFASYKMIGASGIGSIGEYAFFLRDPEFGSTEITSAITEEQALDIPGVSVTDFRVFVNEAKQIEIKIKLTSPRSDAGSSRELALVVHFQGKEVDRSTITLTVAETC